MTKARALQLLERHVDMFDARGELHEALDALRPKPRAVKVQTTAPEACKTIIRNLSRPEGFGFSPPASETNRLMRAEMGPEASDYNAPARPVDGLGYVQFGSPEQKAREDAERAYNAERARWVASPDGARFEAYDRGLTVYANERTAWLASPDAARFADDRARHEARRAQFAYVSPKGAKTTDGTLATYVGAFVARTSNDSLEEVA